MRRKWWNIFPSLDREMKRKAHESVPCHLPRCRVQAVRLFYFFFIFLVLYVRHIYGGKCIFFFCPCLALLLWLCRSKLNFLPHPIRYRLNNYHRRIREKVVPVCFVFFSFPLRHSVLIFFSLIFGSFLPFKQPNWEDHTSINKQLSFDVARWAFFVHPSVYLFERSISSKGHPFLFRWVEKRVNIQAERDVCMNPLS